jgi:tetratricopeptide (TPR) repeat protein
MHHADLSQAYLNLANHLFRGRISEHDLSAATSRLPPLSEALLVILGQHSEKVAGSKPRYGWSIAKVAYSAAITQKQDLFVRSLAVWNVGRAANHWGQPKRVKIAIDQAHRGFSKLNKRGWLAACDWQLNALPWTKSDFSNVAITLANALENLEDTGPDQFIPHCRLSLAYAQILIKAYDKARENIEISKAIFVAQGDTLNQARCWLHEASYLRRTDKFDQALDKLEMAVRVFEAEDAFADKAKAFYQIGLCHLLRTDDLSKAIEQLEKAASLFSNCDMDLWRAMCITNLGSVYLYTGDLTLADKHYQDARKVFVRNEIPGLLADNIHDCGEMNILRGKPHISIEQFKQAVDLNESLGSRLSAGVSMTSLGRAYGQSGRYQDALLYLERAANRLKSLGSHLRLGTCEMYTALVWLQLGQPAIAHEHLDRAAKNYESADQKALLSEIYSYRARAFFQQGLETSAIECLEKSLTLAVMYGVRPRASLARRLLGEGMVQIGRYEEALVILKQALAESADMDLFMNQAACLVACGTCYSLISDPNQAQDAYEQALKLSGEALPEIEWIAHIGLGDIASFNSKVNQALKAYRRGAEIFTQIRRNFWQPTLAGSYLQGPARIFDKIVSFASIVGSAHDTLFLVEQGKESTLLGQLLVDNLPSWNPKSQELNDLQAEIGLLQEWLGTSIDKSLLAQATPQYRQMLEKLHEKTQQYGELKARLERQTIPSHKLKSMHSNSFNLLLFRQLANNILCKKWIALDYYLVGNQLVTIVVTPDTCDVLCTTITNRCIMALDACDKARRKSELPLQSDLDVLGKLLIPNSLSEKLSTDIYLLLSPHRKLHVLPWAALRPDINSEPLACVCIPTVVPSLQSLVLLWQRSDSNHAPSRDAGLLVGLSDFHGRHRELPHVNDEINYLKSKLGSLGKDLTEGEATWENLMKLSREQTPNKKVGLSRFAWLHIASHYFSDDLTGRLSGLALWDVDIWLDQLRDLKRLPDLVTFSACNSNSSFVYEGDEHVDLPTTCLIAGAKSVVGSIWPVVDQAAIELMSGFYNRYLIGLQPAQALAQAQREIIGRGEKFDNWAGYICIGMP